MDLKKRLKKGGIADIVTLMIIIGIVIALIIAVVIPMMNKTSERGVADTENLEGISGAINSLGENSYTETNYVSEDGNGSN